MIILVRFIQHLVDFLRRASRSSGDLEWASEAVLYLCWTNEKASTAVMDIVCQGLVRRKEGKGKRDNESFRATC